MNTGGITGPAENKEEIKSFASSINSKIERIRASGKFCRELIKKPFIVGKIKEFHQGLITKTDLEILFKRELSLLDDTTKKSLGIGSSDEALDMFIRETSCFEDQFLYEIHHDVKLKETAHQEIIRACIDTVADEYILTDEHKDTLTVYLEKQSPQSIINFLEIPKTRRLIIKKVLASELTTKTLNDIDFNSLHNKIANLPPGPHTRRIQDVWNTMTGGFKVGSGETIQQAFERIQLDGTEGDLSADYEVFFGDENTCISSENKKRILDFLVRMYAPTVSLIELENIDHQAAQDISKISPDVINQETHSSDQETKSALLAYREESALSDRRTSLITHRIPTRSLNPKTQMKIVGQIGSARRIKELNAFHSGRPGGLSSQNSQQFEEVFLDTYKFSPEDVSCDSKLSEKLQIQLGNKINHLEKFVPGSVMTWRAKSPDAQKDLVGYYYIENTLGDDAENPGEIKIRFLGNNQSQKKNNPHEKGKISRSGIPRTYTGPQFFDYLAGCSENGSIDFVDAGVDFSSTDFQKQLEQDGTSFYTDEELHAELRHRHGTTEIQSQEALNQDLDELLYQGGGQALESNNPLERNLYPGLVFALQKDSEIDTFEITDIIPPGDDGEPGMVHVWDGWGSGPDSRREMTFREFYNTVKHLKTSTYNTVFRIPWGQSGKRLNVDQFNKIMQSEPHNGELKHKQNKKVFIRDGKLFQYDANGNSAEKTMVTVGGGKDLHILSIDDETVEVSQGTFKQTKWDEKAGKFTQKPEFHGTPPYRIPLAIFWSYLQKNTYQLDKEDLEKKYKAPKEQKSQMSWLNIFKHAHSLGTILHGDLWKGPWKAFEEQHHKDHAFAGKITAALAVEKLQKIPGIGSALFDYDWANLMVGDANSNFQSYLEGLVNIIDGMGSAHRARMIKKWSQLHFPDPKFMAAMFASMKIFGQLYPDDDGKNDARSSGGVKEWFWYNSITHTKSVPIPDGWPAHMPPHGDGDKWPNKNGHELTEIQACHELFLKFNHPLLKNLGRRYQKYMNGGHKELIDGGSDNLDQRGTMEEKLDWMMNSVMTGKPTEIFGSGTEKWLDYGYPTSVTTMPYAALLFGGREQQLLPKTQEHLLKELFQAGSHVPMFVFAQSKNLGDIFRDTGVAFAYTISEEAGKELESLVEYVKHHRVHKKSSVNGEDWTKKFKKFWKNHGSQLMNKLTGMKDPMLNLMMNAPETFDQLIDSASPDKRKKYNKLREHKGSILAYYDRLKDTYDSPGHAEMPRGKGFYSGDNFRFRDKLFENGYPLFWINWGAYLEQLDPSFLAGSGEKKGDGLFNEVRGFIDAIPDMAKKIVEQDMGITQDPDKRNAINDVCRKLYTKNVTEQIYPNMPNVGTSPEAAYCSIPAMILGMSPLKKISVGGTDTPDLNKYAGYYERMQKVLQKAKEMEKTDFSASIRYRTEQWKKWQEIVKNRISLDDIDASGDQSVSVFQQNKSYIQPVTTQILEQTEAVLRQNNPNSNSEQVSMN